LVLVKNARIEKKKRRERRKKGIEIARDYEIGVFVISNEAKKSRFLEGLHGIGSTGDC